MYLKFRLVPVRAHTCEKLLDIVVLRKAHARHVDEIVCPYREERRLITLWEAQ